MLTKRAVETMMRAVAAAGDDADAVRAALVDIGVPTARLGGDLDDLFELVAAVNETRHVPTEPAESSRDTPTEPAEWSRDTPTEPAESSRDTPTELDAELAARARAWLADDPDPTTRAELEALLEAGDGAAIAARFGERLTFGTAGIRGELGAGPSRMNVAMVRATAAGVVTWLTDPGRGVVLGRDGRRRSDDFERDAAQVVSGAGVPALVLPGRVPTPLLAFAVRHLGAAGGLMVTASHNPPDDNGVKVYGDDGAQIVPPSDGIIAGAIERISSVRTLPMSDAHVHHLGDEVLDAYVDAAAHIVADGPRDVRVVHTSMHGVGWEAVRRLFARAGFAEPIPVPQQRDPDGDFPTVAFPNPEEPGALDLALALAADVDADVVLANDPDADRLGVAVPDGSGFPAQWDPKLGIHVT